MVPDAIDFYKPDKGYETVTWQVLLASEMSFASETETFDSETEANSAVADNLELIDLKIDQLMKLRDRISLQQIRKVVD